MTTSSLSARSIIEGALLQHVERLASFEDPLGSQPGYLDLLSRETPSLGRDHYLHRHAYDLRVLEGGIRSRLSRTLEADPAQFVHLWRQHLDSLRNRLYRMGEGLVYWGVDRVPALGGIGGEQRRIGELIQSLSDANQTLSDFEAHFVHEKPLPFAYKNSADLQRRTIDELTASLHRINFHSAAAKIARGTVEGQTVPQKQIWQVTRNYLQLVNEGSELRFAHYPLATLGLALLVGYSVWSLGDTV